MRKLIKVIAVPILCGIVIASSFFVSEFHSEGEDVVAIPRASVVEKTEPVITVLQEESIPIATEEMEGSEEVIPKMSREDRRSSERCRDGCSSPEFPRPGRS